MIKTNKPIVLITGGAGFIGSHLCESLLEGGHAVVCIDDLSTGFKENIEQLLAYPDFEFVQGDICDPVLLKKAAGGISCLIHLAAKKIPRYGKALATLTTNNEGTKNALQIAMMNRCKFVLASTSDVYGKGTPPFKEGDNLIIGSSDIRRWSYAASKIFDEHLTMAFNQEHDLETVILRFFGTYGPRHHRSWWGGPQAVFIEQALKKEPFSIHGDGSQTRSFTYISDLIDGIIEAIRRDKAIGQIINLGSTEEVSIIQLARKISHIINANDNPRIEYVPYESLGGQYEDVMRRVPDIDKAKRLLGFQVKVDLDAGLTQAITWHKALIRQYI